jgi:hypothetical protein
LAANPYFDLAVQDDIHDLPWLSFLTDGRASLKVMRVFRTVEKASHIHGYLLVLASTLAIVT